MALKVSQKYDDGSDVWLGTGKDAWPVSYQGHSMDGSLGLILTRGEKGSDIICVIMTLLWKDIFSPRHS